MPLISPRADAEVTLSDIQAAAERIKGVVRCTPLMPLEDRRGRRCAVKLESLQITGAFKFRGAYNAVAALYETGTLRGVVAASTGNHAIGVARAARILGVPAVILMPSNAPLVKRQAVVNQGAELILRDSPIDELAELAAGVAFARDFVSISSYDNPDVVAGQGTIGLEVLSQLHALASRGEIDGGPPLILVPLGGGGIASGVAIAVKSNEPAALVIGVEPDTVTKGRDSLASGQLVKWPDDQLYSTAADGLRVPTLGGLPWSILRSWLDGVETVSEAAISEAMKTAAFTGHAVLEPAGAAAIAAWLSGSERPRSVVCIATGGNVDPELYVSLIGGGATALRSRP